MSDLFGIGSGTYEKWQGRDSGPLTREQIEAAMRNYGERMEQEAKRPRVVLVPKWLQDQIAALEKAK